MPSLQCQCSALQGELQPTGLANRLLCYCTDCRAFARLLQRPEVLDAQGGSEIVQLTQSRLRWTRGSEHLAALRLSERGMLRWYAGCCRTPIGNTLMNPKLGFIGLLHSCLDRQQLNAAFGTAVAVVNTDTALGQPKPRQRSLGGAILRSLRLMAGERLAGRYKGSPLFTAEGAPVARPQVLAPAELARLKQEDAHV
ncbi:DUF6151 family protein [Inhella proteolytica]|uniref:Uncharacterized protein n=1 Tax=Inhella proteolytica TaxID=2795029 RepID=A0A931J201_9BURK|nr:DUF6151 family protein [Inhella proteolytica]MBH9576866.1 hypothetical protein [Inhella proteolytica]